MNFTILNLRAQNPRWCKRGRPHRINLFYGKNWNVKTVFWGKIGTSKIAVFSGKFPNLFYKTLRKMAKNRGKFKLKDKAPHFSSIFTNFLLHKRGVLVGAGLVLLFDFSTNHDRCFEGKIYSINSKFLFYNSQISLHRKNGLFKISRLFPYGPRHFWVFREKIRRAKHPSTK